ncbi:TPA: hypothetical protein ACH3X1_012190 [Trebouxia sp. C0004]
MVSGQHVNLQPNATKPLLLSYGLPELYIDDIKATADRTGTSDEVLLALVEIKSLLQVHSVLQLDRFM